MVIIKNIYNKLLFNKNKFYNYNLFKINYNYKIKEIYKKKDSKHIYCIYILKKNKEKFYLKEISGLLIKKYKFKDTLNISLLFLEKYNNVYFSSIRINLPNIFMILKYKFYN